jgi:hypothetical protein
MTISTFNEQYILFLKGVSLEDVISIEDIFNQEIIEIDSSNDSKCKDIIVWDKVPSIFTNLENWIGSTNIRCWFCTLKFKSTPWFIITNINKYSDGKIMDVKGNFCSCGCLMGFVKKNYSNREHFDIYHNVYSLFKIMYNRSIDYITPSPEMYCLKMYGGNLNIEEYQSELKKVNDLNTKI